MILSSGLMGGASVSVVKNVALTKVRFRIRINTAYVDVNLGVPLDSGDRVDFDSTTHDLAP